MYFIDSNIFLRALVKENKRSFNECVNVLSLVKEGKIKAVTSSIVLAEVVWTLSRFYKFPKKKIIRGIQAILNLRGLAVRDGFDPFSAVELYAEHTVKFIDTLIASNADIESGKVTIVSYDKDFDTIGVKRMDPRGVLKKYE